MTHGKIRDLELRNLKKTICSISLILKRKLRGTELLAYDQVRKLVAWGRERPDTIRNIFIALNILNLFTCHLTLTTPCEVLSFTVKQTKVQRDDFPKITNH